jgi:HAD superfamily hydrolase (TIGR01509 family)
MRQFKAIIFDMDGVIVDSEPLHERAFLEVFAEMGYGNTHGIHFADYYGRSDQAVWLDFIARHHPPQPFEELLAWKQRRLVELLVAEKPIFDGLPELVGQLASRFKLGVASGSPHNVIDEVLRLENLRRFFPVVVSVTDVDRGKPAPDVFLRTAELLAVAPADCCVIEDAAAGVEAALAAGMEVIAITNTLPAAKLARASQVVHGYSEIAALLAP